MQCWFWNGWPTRDELYERLLSVLSLDRLQTHYKNKIGHCQVTRVTAYDIPVISFQKQKKIKRTPCTRGETYTLVPSRLSARPANQWTFCWRFCYFAQTYRYERSPRDHTTLESTGHTKEYRLTIQFFMTAQLVKTIPWWFHLVFEQCAAMFSRHDPLQLKCQ